MGKTTAKTITAAPKKQVKVQITIKSKASGKPIAGVPGLLLASNGSGQAVSRNLGKSDGLGRLKFNEEPGKIEIQVRHPNHAGEGLATLPSVADTTIVLSGVLEAGDHSFDVTMVQIRAQVTFEVTDEAGGAALGGVTVSRSGEVGLTNERGKYVTTALGLGVNHKFELTRNGHGPAGALAIGPVKAEVDLTGLTEVANRTLSLKMKNFWGKVRSGSLKVSEKDFTTWFPEFAKGFPSKHPTLMYHGNPAPTFPFAAVMARNPNPFLQLFNDLPKWFDGGQLTLEEFVAIFMIVSNETGGSYKPISEKGDLAYMFYLNKGPNRLAGDQLGEKGLLTDKARILAWNAKGKDKFPGVGTDGITQENLEACDFWKYRGRGFVQTTLRTLYIDRVDPILKAAGLNESESLTSSELDDAVLNNADVYYPLLKREIVTRHSSLAKANAEQWKPFGYAVAGTTNHEYAALYEWRCQELYKELRKAAEAGKLVLG